MNGQNRQGFTALHIAIMADNLPIFELLLKQPTIELNIKSTEEHTPLYYALLKYESGREVYAEELLKKGVQTNPVYSNNCDCLLQVMLQMGTLSAASYLVKNVQNLNHVNLSGESILHTACSKNAYEFVKQVLDLGANPNLLTVDSRRAPLHYVAQSGAVDCIKVFSEFNKNLGSGAGGEPKIAVNFNVRDLDGDTPLSLALNEGKKELVPLMIEGNADVNVRNGKDFTLLHQAILREDSETALFLLDNKADINAK